MRHSIVKVLSIYLLACWATEVDFVIELSGYLHVSFAGRRLLSPLRYRWGYASLHSSSMMMLWLSV
jgi:hypothetical protein